MNQKVLILLGSDSDRKHIEPALPYFEFFGISAEIVISSAHRNPDKTAEIASNARVNGYSALICGAGMAAHLAGVCAAHTDIPVIGLPLPGGLMDGLDSLLATVQMPSGIPVATMTVGKAGAINAAVFCARILSLHDKDIVSRLEEFQQTGSKLKT
ncbi:5-(carboxyamino)imidazole ribonucleotide mutase [Calditrichota bacterium]